MICQNTLRFNGFSLCLRITYVLRGLDTWRFRVNKRSRQVRNFNGGTFNHLYRGKIYNPILLSASGRLVIALRPAMSALFETRLVTLSGIIEDIP